MISVKGASAPPPVQEAVLNAGSGQTPQTISWVTATTVSVSFLLQNLVHLCCAYSSLDDYRIKQQLAYEWDLTARQGQPRKLPNTTLDLWPLQKIFLKKIAAIYNAPCLVSLLVI